MNRSQATKLAKRLLREHGLVPADPMQATIYDWTVDCTIANDHANLAVVERGELGCNVGFAGVCLRKYKVILLSPYAFSTMTDAEARRTILHEIAHALASKDGHGPEWRRIARRIGGL